MDKNAIKRYAIWARRELIERVSQKAARYGITADTSADANEDSIGGKLLTDVEKKQRQALISKIKEQGYDQVIEEVAYTWFNRFVALRFMEVNGYLPSHVRVFTDESGDFKPQILAEAIHLDLDGLDMRRVYDLKNENKSEELYKYLLITQCNALNKILPGIFQKIEDYTELLLPDNLLREGSVIERLVSEIDEDDFDINSEEGQVEIIGWFYQYYISEKHEEVIDPLHGKVVHKDEVPAATQLFTTDWVVRYLIDNSVGRYWIERNPKSNLAQELIYFVKPKSGEINYIDERITPQDVTVLDPCVGSGHFLVYAFDVLMKIYVEYGYTEREAAVEIVNKNLYGLDIDGRATQLAYFAVMMKARQYDRSLFKRDIYPHIHEVVESNNIDKFAIEYLCTKDEQIRNDIDTLIEVFNDAKEYGTILHIPEMSIDVIRQRIDELSTDISIYTDYIRNDIVPLVEAADIMLKKYTVVATNPPYLNKYDSKLKAFVTKNYKDYSGDLFSVFMYRNFDYCVEGGYSGFMTPFVWMFIKTYEKLRSFIINEKHLTSLIQMEYSAFEEATVPICAFILKNARSNQDSLCLRLSEFRGGMDVQRQKVEYALTSPECGFYYNARQSDFLRIKGSPIAYWASDAVYSAYENSQSIGEVASPKQGLATTDNNRFVRFWFEVNIDRIGFGFTRERAKASGIKWFPFNKGGEYRKWYGNNECIVNYQYDGKEIKANVLKKYSYLKTPDFVVKNQNMYFLKNGTWSAISSADISVRYSPRGYIISNAGMAIYSKDLLKYIIAFMNSKCISESLLSVINQTINFNAGDIERIPLIIDSGKKELIECLTDLCIDTCKKDWDSFETSWDFQSHPLAPSVYERQEQLDAGMNSDERRKSVSLLSERYRRWDQECENRFLELKKNEEELNRIFIDIYGLQDELTPEVEDKDVTVRKADLIRDIKSFISYAVGCMFGRYSLDEAGLVYAGGEWDASKYKTFPADEDAIIPICDDEYFDDDIVGRFVEFVRVVYGEESLETNLQFIADALGGKGSSREVIRNYFISDFYKDHCKIYQKRPIYWLFDSGKKGGFKCLVYMHRYKADTIARIRTDYLHEQQSRYRTAIEDVEQRMDTATTSERVKLDKRLSALQSQSEEARLYEEKIHHFADQMISIDLDDGVKHNYEIFKDVLAKIK